MIDLKLRIVLEGLGRVIVDNMRKALETKKVQSISRRQKDGKVTEKTFSSTTKASGKSARSLRYEVTEEGNILIYGEESILTLIFGRKPTSASGSGKLKDIIKKWMNDKGISPEGNMSEDTLAFLISRKIHKYGSGIYLKHQGANSGIFSKAFDSQNLKQFTDALRLSYEGLFVEAMSQLRTGYGK